MGGKIEILAGHLHSGADRLAAPVLTGGTAPVVQVFPADLPANGAAHALGKFMDQVVVPAVLQVVEAVRLHPFGVPASMPGAHRQNGPRQGAAGVPAPEGRETPSGGWSPVSPARGKAAPADGYGKLFEDRPGAVSRTLIIGGRYVVTPAASGMMVVNIRRATERILYERTLKALSGAREHVSQTTLFPVELRLGVERRLVIDEHADLLARIGFDIKPCGEDSISVEGVPEGYSSSPGDVQSAVEELTDILSQEGGALQEIMNQRLAGKIAASGAAGAEKIGTPLQAQRLIDTLFECDNAEATADGRRTVNIISTEDIDKLF